MATLKILGHPRFLPSLTRFSRIDCKPVWHFARERFVFSRADKSQPTRATQSPKLRPLVNEPQGGSFLIANLAGTTAEGVGMKGGVAPKKEKNPRKRKHNAANELRKELDMFSKAGDVVNALEFYDKHQRDADFTFQQYHYNILLYLCASAASGVITKGGRKRSKDSEESPSSDSSNLKNEKEDLNQDDNDQGEENGNVIHVSEEIQKLASKRGLEIYSQMRKNNVEPNEATFTAVSRLAMAEGDGVQAFSFVKEMANFNILPRLRSYGPSLFTFCTQNAVKEAFEVDEHMTSHEVSPGEAELRALLKLSVENGLADKVYSLIHRLRKTVRDLETETISVIEKWFGTESAEAAASENVPAEEISKSLESKGGGYHGLGWLGKGKWTVNRTKINEAGICKFCKQRLITVDLDEEETLKFTQSLAKLACERESASNEFNNFMRWLDKNGPFDAIVDAANVGLYNQNFAQGGFNFWQLDKVVEATRGLSKKKSMPLIVLHHKRTKGDHARTPFAQRCLNSYRKSNCFYPTPTGSNDDWYWLYAAVKYKALLITNDEMRDHIFQLLGNDFFPMWKERHQVRFTMNSSGPQLHLPPPYSIVIQESIQGSWHFPQKAEDEIGIVREWLCVRRENLATTDHPNPVVQQPSLATIQSPSL